MTAIQDEEEKLSTEEINSPIEWILWKHLCKQHVKNDSQWKEGVSEMAHFFASPSTPLHCDLDHLPLPSKSFFTKNTSHDEHHKAPPKHTEYSMFQKGIFPDWEDPECKGELYTKHYFPMNLLDEYWQCLIQGVMEGDVDCQHVCGVRIIDKSHGKHPLYKLELWLNTTDVKIRTQVRDQAMKCMRVDEHHKFKLHWRAFPSEDDKNNHKNNSSSKKSVTDTVSIESNSVVSSTTKD